MHSTYLGLLRKGDLTFDPGAPICLFSSDTLHFVLVIHDDMCAVHVLKMKANKIHVVQKDKLFQMGLAEQLG